MGGAGVAYAQQPVGELRWKPPRDLLQPSEPPNNALRNPFVRHVDATRLGHICIQEFRFYMKDTEPNTDGTFQTESEACLYHLNTHTHTHTTTHNHAHTHARIHTEASFNYLMALRYLNIFTPLNANSSSKLPVLVWGHGGGDGSGAATQGIPLLFNGSNIVSTSDAISVTINYR